MIIDIILILIVLLGAYVGYKKGLVTVLMKFIAIIIAIALSLFLQSPVADCLRNSKLGNDLYINVHKGITNTIDARREGIEKDTIYSKIIDGVVSEEQINIQADNITTFILKGVSFIATFLITLIIIFILKGVLNIVFDLPILNSINKIGGLTVGGLKSIVIIYLILAAIAFISPMPIVKGNISNKIEKTNITKIMYENNLLVQIINGSIKK